ncbi:hypothetical protein V3330_13350 [Wenzhouxiangellaceae bacterium CH-27]|uniref:CarD C-terminal domain-containing protein n=2 Tax=Elongatibacter sediminis TaxID=3119006 RepID=A0AAW9RET6_9GAMM
MLRENDLDEMVREPIGPSEARQLIDHIKSWKGKTSTQWKTRANAHQAKMEKDDPFSYAEVYKSLRKRQKEDRLSAADRTHLRQTTDFLTEELANALGKTPDQMLAKIEEATRS